MTFRLKTLLALATIASLTACTGLSSTKTVSQEPPVTRWDHRPEGKVWTQKTLLAVASEDAELAASVPADIALWCPSYPEASIEDRRAFWVGLMSAVAKHESTWNPEASGGGGRWIGLLQISPGTAKQYGCDATSSAALKDGVANLSCAVEILSVQVGRDNAVAGNGAQGMGRDWAPFRSASKRAEMAAWTSAQPYCVNGGSTKTVNLGNFGQGMALPRSPSAS